jgi:hypothetical protein
MNSAHEPLKFTYEDPRIKGNLLAQLRSAERFSYNVYAMMKLVDPPINYDVIGVIQQGYEIDITPALDPIPDVPALIFYLDNGVISHEQLAQAEQNLEKGYKVTFTKDKKRVFEPKADHNESVTETTEKPQYPECHGQDYKADYWNLRTALRQGIQRATGISLQDTAEIANRLRQTKNLEEATQSFEILVGSIKAIQYNESLEEQLEQALEDERINQKRLAQLEENIRLAMETFKGIKKATPTPEPKNTERQTQRTKTGWAPTSHSYQH